MRRPRILVVDDEANIVKFVGSNLRTAGYEVLTAGTGEEALELAQNQPLDLVILDLMLPGVDGLEVCRRLSSSSDMPVIVLSAKDDEGDKVAALKLGADDYLTKPFGVGELLARVQAVLRRTGRRVLDTGTEVLAKGPFALDSATHELTCLEQRVKLTRTEFELLHYLMQHADKVVPHNVLLSKIWGTEYRNQTEYLRVYIGRLRQKIEPDPSNPHHLLTEPGFGYLFRPEPRH